MHEEYIECLVKTLKATQFFEHTQSLSSFELGMQKLVDYISTVKQNGKQLYFIGNGGSSAIASHMTADFMKNGGMKTYSLYDNAVTTCMGNDYGYEFIFSKPLSFLINEGDLLIAISSSGNSKNIINAIEVAKEKKANVITFSGFKEDNLIKSKGVMNVYVPISQYGIVESIHNLILQQVVDTILERDGVNI